MLFISVRRIKLYIYFSMFTFFSDVIAENMFDFS
jgi:hypothetical protein